MYSLHVYQTEYRKKDSQHKMKLKTYVTFDQKSVCNYSGNCFKIINTFSNMPEPVSYTHLDVYKRQEQSYK